MCKFQTVCTKSLQSCLTVCDPMGCSPPSSSVHGILQARILEWVAKPSHRGDSQPRDGTGVSYVSHTGRRVLYRWPTREAHTNLLPRVLFFDPDTTFSEQIHLWVVSPMMLAACSSPRHGPTLCLLLPAWTCLPRLSLHSSASYTGRCKFPTATLTKDCKPGGLKQEGVLSCLSG